MRNIKSAQKNIVKSFEESHGIVKKRTDVVQILIDKAERIGESVTRNRCWRGGILMQDYLTVINNVIAEPTVLPGFKKR